MTKSVLKAVVLDDSALSAKLVRRMLERVGFEVKTAVTLDDFREVLVDFAPDVVFSDLQMPEFPNDSVCHVLRQESNVGRVPIWILSSLMEGELAQRARACGADGYLSKSLDPSEIEARLRVLGQRWAVTPPPYGEAERIAGREQS
jgi:DNA-binding response OmpR family regulator